MIKKLLLLSFLIPFISFSQVQIGNDIDGEAENDRCGTSVSLNSDGSIIAIGAPFNDSNGANSGHVRVFENQNGNWIQIGQDIVGEATGDQSGTSVSLNSDGSIIAIGAPFNDGSGANSGHVRVFENQNGNWIQIGQDISGGSVSLSSDGSIVAISGELNIDNGTNSESVRVFKNQNGNWIQIGQDINGEAPDDNAGFEIISSDGNILAIGAPFNDGNGNNSGHVRIYENQNGNWNQIGQDIDGEAAGDSSGYVSLSSNGSIIAIGAPFNNGNGVSSGHVRIYKNQNDNWIQIGQDIDGEAADDLSFIVSLSSDGSIVAIGATQNDGNGNNSGHVRIYENQNGNWNQIGQDINGEAAGDSLGLISVSLSSDGSIVAIGAPRNDDNGLDSGHVRVYDLSNLLTTKEQIISDFNIYPNPTKNKFIIQLENTTELKTVNIYNNLGQLVLSSKETTINSSKLSAGIYVVEIETNKGKGSKKLIIE